MKTARLRLRSVTWKDGRAPLRVFYPPEPHDYRADIKLDVLAALELHGPDCAGFAFAVWDSDNEITTVAWCGSDSRIPSSMVPEFVARSLLDRRNDGDDGSDEADDDEF